MYRADARVEISRGLRYRAGLHRLAALALAAVALGLAPGAAAAPTRAVAAAVNREFQAGVDAYRLGKYDEARAHLDKAAGLDGKLPGPHRFLAAVAQAQHRFADCVSEARRAIQLNPQSKEIVETRKLHDDCRVGDGRPAYRGELGDAGAAIAVTTTAAGAAIAGATVKIAGLRYGGTPVEPRRIEPGTLALELDKPGFKPARVTIDALPGIVTDVAVELEPIAPSSAPSGPAAR
jgi:tetratricopeptide (TPR) repeat protein